MADEQICGECLRYYPITVPTGKGSSKETSRGHCLAKSVYAKNKPGNPVYPPGAKIADLVHNQHKIVVVRKDQKSPECLFFQGAKKK